MAWTEKEIKIVDKFNELLNREIGEGRRLELWARAFNEAGVEGTDADPCPVLPHCSPMCHIVRACGENYPACT